MGEAKRAFRLESGDTAYIPRGFAHDARSTSDISLHITVGLLSYTWADLIVDAVSELCLRDPQFRKSLPPGFASPTFDPRCAEKRFHQLLERLGSQADFKKSFSAFVDEFVGSRRQLFRSQPNALATSKSVQLDQILRPRDFLIYSLDLEAENSTIILKTYGLEMRLPVVAEKALRHALSAPAFTPRDLPGPLDEEGRLTLVRRLIREGLILRA